MVEFLALAQQCAPDVHPATLSALVRTESGFNPYAIGVVGGRLERQPTTLDEAVATAEQLQRNGWNASFGLGQVNLRNLARFRLDTRSVFNPCENLRASAAILSEAYARARQTEPNEQKALRSALSMYYSGNPVTGVQHGYVAKVVGNAGVHDGASPTGNGAAISVIRNTSAGAGVAASRIAPSDGRGRREDTASASASASASAAATAAAAVAAEVAGKAAMEVVASAPSSARANATKPRASFAQKPMW
ncbi:MAG: transglycosylase domain protein [Rhizobacter sp.]|nr:transglycosylase domain protein [Rhizobacter sp.]